jgi:hypothetical protein
MPKGRGYAGAKKGGKKGFGGKKAPPFGSKKKGGKKKGSKKGNR